MITIQQLEDAKKRAEAAGNTDAVNELSERIAQFNAEIDVSHIFYDHSNTKPPEQPAFVGFMDTVGDAIGGVVGPTTVGILAGAANPLYNALTKERGITLPKEEGEKKGKKISADDARKRLSDARSAGQADFEAQKKLDLEELQKEVDIKRNALLPEKGHLQATIDDYDQAIVDTKKFFNDAVNKGDTIAMEWNANHLANLEAGKAPNINRLNEINSELSGLDAQVNQAANTKMSAAQAIDADSQTLKAMGIEPPDVSKEIEAGDIDGARKKMSDLLEKNLQSKTAWMKSAVDYMKKNPGKAIPRGLAKVGKATFTGDTGKKALVGGFAGGLLTNIATGTYDALTGDYLSEEEAEAERQKFIELGRLAEQYRNPSRGENTMYLNPLVPEQKQVIDQLQQAQSDPNRSYLLYKANLPYEARQLPSN